MEVSISAAESQPTLWTSLAEAIRGSHQDYTSGSLNRAIFLLAVPMVLEMVLESLFAVVDVFWVGRLGANAVATVGLTESIFEPGLCRGYGVEPVHDSHGGAAHRRKGFDGCCGGGGSGHRARSDAVDRHRRTLPGVGPASAAVDGVFP